MALDDSQHLERRLDRDRVRGHHRRLVDGLKLRVELPGACRVPDRCGFVYRPHLGAHQMRADQDATRATELEAAKEHGVVAGKQVQALDRPELVVVCLLDGDHVVDPRRELRQELGRQVDHRARGDVVEDHRRVAGRLSDRLEVSPKPGAIGLVVVGSDDQDRVGTEPAGPPRQLDGVAGVVRARPADDRRLL